MKEKITRIVSIYKKFETLFNECPKSTDDIKISVNVHMCKKCSLCKSFYNSTCYLQDNIVYCKYIKE